MCLVCFSEDTNALKNEVNEYTARAHRERTKINTNTQHRREKERKSFLVRLASTWLDFFLP